jgi:hypothetical protein
MGSAHGSVESSLLSLSVRQFQGSPEIVPPSNPPESLSQVPGSHGTGVPTHSLVLGFMDFVRVFFGSFSGLQLQLSLSISDSLSLSLSLSRSVSLSLSPSQSHLSLSLCTRVRRGNEEQERRRKKGKKKGKIRKKRNWVFDVSEGQRVTIRASPADALL